MTRTRQRNLPPFTICSIKSRDGAQPVFHRDDGL